MMSKLIIRICIAISSIAFLSSLDYADAQTQTVCNTAPTWPYQVTCNSYPQAAPQSSLNDLLSEIAKAKRNKQEAADRAETQFQMQQALKAQQKAAEAQLAQQEANAAAQAEQRRRLETEHVEAQRQEQSKQDAMAAVSTAVLEGRCDDAKTAALQANNLDLAEQAMRLCKPKPAVKVAPEKGAAVKGKPASAGTVAATPSVTQDFQLGQGSEASYRGAYATAYRLWRPLADRGLAAAQSNLKALCAAHPTTTGCPYP